MNILNTLVVPSIREDSWNEFINAWWMASFDRIILIEDNPEKTFDSGNVREGIIHYSWKEIEEDLGENAWIISRRDSAIRCYGFYKAHQMGAKYIFTLDDDCHPTAPMEFTKDHINAIENVPKWTESIPGIRTRGLPYNNKGDINTVVANMGLWKGIPDWDSIQQISGNTPEFAIPDGNRIIPLGQYIPVCGMNLCFKAEMSPAAYFPLMGENSPYRRFDDIWFGIIFKKICDHLGLHLSVGQPAIIHKRASDPMTSLVKEAPGIKANETFWELIDEIKFKNNDPKGCMLEIGTKLELEKDEYFSKLGRAIQIWANLF